MRASGSCRMRIGAASGRVSTARPDDGLITRNTPSPVWRCRQAHLGAALTFRTPGRNRHEHLAQRGNTGADGDPAEDIGQPVRTGVQAE